MKDEILMESRYIIALPPISLNGSKVAKSPISFALINPGHDLRVYFLQEAKLRKYSYVTGYVHRSVIMNRLNSGEAIEIIQKYEPDKLDYYRIDLGKKATALHGRKETPSSSL